MKTKKILSLMLAGALIAGTISACTPAAPAPVVPEAAPAQQVPTPTPVVPQVPEPPPEAQVGRGVTLAIMTEAASVQPARHGQLVAHWKQNLSHNGIFRVWHEDLSPVLDLAESMVAISDTVFEFTLRPNIMFHNGEIMTAYDVVAGLYYNRTSPESINVHRSMYSAEVVSRYVFRIDSGEPNAMLFFDLAHHGNFIQPRSLIEAGHDFSRYPVGSGPFEFEEWNLGTSLKFTRFADYFDRDRVAQVEYILWRIIPEGASRTIALEAGEVDYIVDVPLPDLARLQADPNITVIYRPGTMHAGLHLNNERPPFDNIHVRHAIDMALDRDSMLLASLDGHGIPIWTSAPPMFPGVSSEGIRSFDPEGARALLAEHNLDPATLGFEMLVSDEITRRRAEVAQANLADIGIPTTITQMDSATWLSHAGAGDFEAGFGSVTSSNIMAFMRMFFYSGSIGAMNWSRIDIPELSELVLQSINTPDPDARLPIVEQATRMANEHAGFISTNMNILFRAFNSDLVVPELAPNGMMYLNMVHWAD